METAIFMAYTIILVVLVKDISFPVRSVKDSTPPKKGSGRIGFK